ncbi:MAG: variant-type mycofactocin precursor [Clostridia bacterium]|nr:variant-type mycofactocin precursor [Clostridia bacterium]
MEQQISMEHQAGPEVPQPVPAAMPPAVPQEVWLAEPLILEDVIIETLAIDGICGVY